MEQISDLTGEIWVSSEMDTHISAGGQQRGASVVLWSGKTTPAKPLRVWGQGVQSELPAQGQMESASHGGSQRQACV